ncbi:hypothetical protein D6T64_12155 [Cryobacterium melibiosiphilum]|uniref:Uncharacterized protein n=1 Tax=Cryobacterium melibiosiphilum TaxID=995039 RepID=A0A3A5MFD8_9MICO|nr:hypothetical protein [Cryobacterium melibiosiphilum]RJT88132.1 hypothetical protein D6T64_12155 [Cryobacterium melibiosiphilum]
MARTGNNTRIAALGTYGGSPTFAADLTEIAGDAAKIIGESESTVSALPTSGNWPGRCIYVTATKALYISDGGTGWQKITGLTRAGTHSGTTSQGGDLFITFDPPFTSVCTGLVVTDSNTGGGIGPVPLKVVSRTATTGTVRVMNGSAAVVSFTTSFNYIAFGD